MLCNELMCRLQQGITYHMLQWLVEYKASSASLAVIKYQNDCLHCTVSSGGVQVNRHMSSLERTWRINLKQRIKSV